MDRFVSNLTSKVDAKGRVSIPASFRAVLARDGFEGLYVHPTLDAPALDAGGHRLIGEIDAFLSTLPAYSDARDQLSTALYGTSEILKLDGEGRIGVTEMVRAHAGLTDAVTFVGLGHKFQLWHPDRFQAHLAEARERVRILKRGLGRESGPVTGPSSPGARDR